MLFNSLVFVVFLLVVLAAYYAAPGRAVKYVLLVASYFFYGWWDWRFLGLLLLSTVMDYYVALVIEKSSRQRIRNILLAISMTLNLGLLGVFKYFNFFADSLETVLRTFGFAADYATLSIVLPVGISFYTFQTMSYTIDVWRGEMKAERNFILFAAFVAFFPQLVAGPIERASSLLPQLSRKRWATFEQIKGGTWLIIWGYFLKVFLADNLGPVVDQIYASYETVSGFDVLVAHYAFAFQIFGDFAGYSYIAIGVARYFGVNLTENFRFPYFVKTPSEFWRNWHISLSTWLRDYLYIPLGGNRGPKWFTYRNLMLTMMLGGLWHGAAWNFVLWGIYQGAILCVFRYLAERSSGRPPGWIESSWVSFLRVILMFHLTCFGWMLFRTPDMATLGSMLSAVGTDLFHLDRRSYYWLAQTAAFVAVPLGILWFQFRRNNPQENPFGDEMVRGMACATLLVLLMGLGNWGTRSFIYFQF